MPISDDVTESNGKNYSDWIEHACFNLLRYIIDPEYLEGDSTP